MTVDEALAELERRIDDMVDSDRHRIAGAWKTVKEVMGGRK